MYLRVSVTPVSCGGMAGRDGGRDAAGGVQTAMSNMGNAITKGIAGVMDEIGQDRISGVLNDLKGGINDFFGVARDLAGDAAPVMAQRQDVAGKSFLRGIVHFAILPYSGRALSQCAGICNITGKRAHCQGRKGRRFRQERAEPRKTFM